MDLELATAKYLPVEHSELAESAEEVLPCEGTIRGCSLARASWLVGCVVAPLLLVSAGLLLWQNRTNFQHGAKTVRQKTSNPFDFVLWMGGSKHTFKDAFQEINKRNEAEWDEMCKTTKLKTNFENLNVNSGILVPNYIPPANYRPK